VRYTPILKRSECINRRAACRQHWVEHERHVDRAFGRKFRVILHRLGCFFIAIQAKVPDFGGRNQFEDRIDHRQAGAQDGDESNSLRELPAFGAGDRCLHAHRFAAQVLRRFVGEQRSEPAHQLPELGRGRRLIAQPSEVASDQRMLDFKHAAHKIRFFGRRSRRPLLGRHRSSHGFIPYSTRAEAQLARIRGAAIAAEARRRFILAADSGCEKNRRPTATRFSRWYPSPNRRGGRYNMPNRNGFVLGKRV
jgi:hypothetical protein